MTGSDPVTLFEAGYTLHHLDEARLPEIVVAQLPGLLCKLYAVAFFHDSTLQLRRDFNYFIYSDSSLVAFLTRAAAIDVGFEDLQTAGNLVFCKAFCQ